jgi:glutathione S-transferase
VLEKYKGLTLPSGSSDSEEGKLWQRLQNWIAMTETRKSVIATRSDEDQYFKVYERYARNTANSLVAIATRTGEALP